MIKRIIRNIQGDKTIWFVVILLSLFSVVAVYSSTGTLAYKFQSGNTEYYLFKHFGIVALGLVLMFAAHLIKYTYYSRVSQLAIYLAIPLLAVTLISGTDLNEAKRWLTLPIINISFQTSDFAKLALTMYLARMLTRKQEIIDDWRNGFLPLILPVMITVFLIFPANFSTAAILFTSSVIILYIGRASLKHIGILLLTGIVAVTLFVTILLSLPQENRGRLDTWAQRIENFVSGDSEENYQAEQSKIAIASGGVFGKFPGNSEQRNFLPHPYSDFIYSIIVEEWGLAGGAFIIILYLILLYRAVYISTKVEGTFGSLLAIGLAFILVLQAFINMAVAVNLVPVTGQPLPLVSMGGTSIWFTSISIGIILSVSKEIKTSEKDDTKK